MPLPSCSVVHPVRAARAAPPHPRSHASRRSVIGRVAAAALLGLASLGASALEDRVDDEPPPDARSPWRVWNLDGAGAPAGALRLRPALAAEPHPVLGSGELPRLRPAISLSRGGPVVLSLVARGNDGLLLALQVTP